MSFWLDYGVLFHEIDGHIKLTKNVRLQNENNIDQI